MERQNCHTREKGVNSCVDSLPAVRSTLSITCLLLLLASAVLVGSHSLVSRTATFEGFPRVSLWAWERPEDMRSFDPRLYAVAYLDQTISISDEARSTPRLQPLQFANSAKIIAVVRIEAPTQFARLESSDLVNIVADLIASSTRKPKVSALQIDFDAARSQRAFYAQVLRQVRQRIPESMPISITALASWCGYDSWMKDLPIDEAVPMLFRMGEAPRSSKNPGWKYMIREPLCGESVGVSTDEPWPAIDHDKRIYIFHPRSWDELAVENAEKLIEQ